MNNLVALIALGMGQIGLPTPPIAPEVRPDRSPTITVTRTPRIRDVPNVGVYLPKVVPAPILRGVQSRTVESYPAVTMTPVLNSSVGTYYYPQTTVVSSPRHFPTFGTVRTFSGFRSNCST